MAKRRRRYTDEERASYVAMLDLAGYKCDGTTIGIIQELSDRSGIPTNTLRRWWKRSQNPPPTNLVRDKKVDLVSSLLEEVGQILVQMDYAREDADYKELGVVFGIFIDKLQLLQGKPTERTEQHVKISDSRRRLAHITNRIAATGAEGADLERTH